MVGHIKFCLTVLGGFLLFQEPLHLNQGVGIILTVLGVTAYAHVKVKKELFYKILRQFIS
jgi:solute carrier family 35 protein E3